MPITLRCPYCGEIRFLADDYAEWSTKCTGCHSTLHVPRQDESDSLPAPTAPAESAHVDLHSQNPFADTAVATTRTTETENPYQASTLPAATKRTLPGQRKFLGPDPRLASRWKRLASAIIDTLVLFTIPINLGHFLTVGIRGKAGPIHTNPFGIGAVGLMLLMHSILVSVRGQSIGKLLLGMQIRRTDDDKLPGFFHGIVVRAFLPSVAIWVPCFGSLFVLANPLFIFGEYKQCLHDWIAGTKVLDLKAIAAYEARLGDQHSIWERR
jgi:hypothetical protein